MCSGNCICGKGNDGAGCGQNPSQTTPEEDTRNAFNLGFAEGFKQAREVFWAEFQIKASDAKMVAKYLVEEDPNSLEADGLKIIAATYLHAADVIIRDRRDFPGYIEKEDSLF